MPFGCGSIPPSPPRLLPRDRGGHLRRWPPLPRATSGACSEYALRPSASASSTAFCAPTIPSVPEPDCCGSPPRESPIPRPLSAPAIWRGQPLVHQVRTPVRFQGSRRAMRTVRRLRSTPSAAPPRRTPPAARPRPAATRGVLAGVATGHTAEVACGCSGALNVGRPRPGPGVEPHAQGGATLHARRRDDGPAAGWCAVAPAQSNGPASAPTASRTRASTRSVGRPRGSTSISG